MENWVTHEEGVTVTRWGSRGSAPYFRMIMMVYSSPIPPPEPFIPQHGCPLIPQLLCMTCRYTPDSQCVTQLGKHELFLPLPLICQADSRQMCCYLSHCWTAATTDCCAFLVAVRGFDNVSHTITVALKGRTPVGRTESLQGSGSFLVIFLACIEQSSSKYIDLLLVFCQPADWQEGAAVFF